MYYMLAFHLLSLSLCSWQFCDSSDTELQRFNKEVVSARSGQCMLISVGFYFNGSPHDLVKNSRSWTSFNKLLSVLQTQVVRLLGCCWFVEIVWWLDASYLCSLVICVWDQGCFVGFLFIDHSITWMSVFLFFTVNVGFGGLVFSFSPSVSSVSLICLSHLSLLGNPPCVLTFHWPSWIYSISVPPFTSSG